MSLFLFSFFFFFKQKTAYEMRISDWSSDVCSSDLQVCLEGFDERRIHARGIVGRGQFLQRPDQSLGDETAAVAAEVAAGIRPGVVVDRGIDGHVDSGRGYARQVALYCDSGAREDRKSTRLNSSHSCATRMPSS